MESHTKSKYPNEVQVFGLHLYDLTSIKGSDFVSLFTLDKLCNDKLCMKDIVFTVEENYTLKTNKQVQQVKECFLQFQTAEDASYAVATKEHNLQIQLSNCKLSQSVSFSRPSRDFATRETMRKIGGLVDRLASIENTLEMMGAVRCDGIPRPSDSFIDKTRFESFMSQYKLCRESGFSLDPTAYTLLKTKKPVDLKKLQSSIKTLFDEECDALIQLRELQLLGWDFEF